MTTMAAGRRAVQTQRQELNERTPRPVPEPARGALGGKGTVAPKIIQQIYRTVGGSRMLVDALLLLRPADVVRVDKRERVLPMPAELRTDRRGPGRRKKN
jgi:hypothetical protein